MRFSDLKGFGWFCSGLKHWILLRHVETGYCSVVFRKFIPFYTYTSGNARKRVKVLSPELGYIPSLEFFSAFFSARLGVTRIWKTLTIQRTSASDAGQLAPGIQDNLGLTPYVDVSFYHSKPIISIFIHIWGSTSLSYVGEITIHKLLF